MDELDFWKVLFEVLRRIPDICREFIVGMALDEFIEDRSSNVAGYAGAVI
jgi:hypothetical protein